MVLNNDFREFIASLNAHEVEHLIVGGYALAFHGHPRYTKDIDIWIRARPENARRLIEALHAFGFADLGLREEDFTTAGNVIQLGYPPRRIDLLTQATGLDFEECFAAKVQIDVEGVTLCFLDLEHLKQNKQATGRLQDLADLERLQ